MRGKRQSGVNEAGIQRTPESRRMTSFWQVSIRPLSVGHLVSVKCNLHASPYICTKGFALNHRCILLADDVVQVRYEEKKKKKVIPWIQIPQWGAADEGTKVPSGENMELKRSPFKAWSRSVYSHTCYAYCQGFLPCLFLPFRSIHLHFFQNLSRFLLCWVWLTHGSCVGPQN